MKNIPQKITKVLAPYIKHFVYLVVALLVGITSTYAIGTLTPSGTAGDDTHYSTNDIYSKLVDFTDTPTATSSPFSVPGSVEASFRTLTEIYDLLLAEEDDLVAENIRASTTIFGVEGTVVEGTPDLEWSTHQGSMNWTTAVSTCGALTEGGATAGDWRLPTISELLAAIAVDYIEEDDDEGDIFTNITYYWSGNEASASFDSSNAWTGSWDASVGGSYNPKTTEASVRCVR